MAKTKAVGVVIDSNLLIAALLTQDPASPTARLFQAAQERRIIAYTSPFQLAELVDVLIRPKFRKSVTLNDALAFVELVQKTFRVTAGTYRGIVTVPKDANDDPIVAIALESGTRYLITEDAKHLLPLKVIMLPGHQAVQVVSLEDFNRLELCH